MVQGKASADHTTLLLNCYTKLKDVDKLDQFLRGSGAADSALSLNFDVETAVKVNPPPPNTPHHQPSLPAHPAAAPRVSQKHHGGVCAAACVMQTAL